MIGPIYKKCPYPIDFVIPSRVAIKREGNGAWTNIRFFELDHPPQKLPKTSIMQTVAIFAALICAAAAHTVVKSDRLGSNWAYSVNTPAVTTYAGNWAPQTWTTGHNWNNWNGAQWNGASWTAPVAVARSSVVAAHTPASTYKTVAGVSPIYHANNAWTYPSHTWNTVAAW